MLPPSRCSYRCSPSSPSTDGNPRWQGAGGERPGGAADVVVQPRRQATSPAGNRRRRSKRDLAGLQPFAARGAAMQHRVWTSGRDK